jgi:electron transfer flavoprotein alpha subunit
MSILVIAEHDNKTLNGATLNVVAAAQKIGGDITVLVAGSGAQAVAEQAAQVAGVSKVLLADNAAYANQLAENVAALVAQVGKGYSHILATSTTTGKNVLPRAAALLDVSMISDIIAVESAKTFKRPIYAGNAIATVESSESIVVATVRGTAFDQVHQKPNHPNISPPAPSTHTASP